MFVLHEGVCIREMSVSERCLYQRDICIRGMFVLERCLYQRDVCIRQMFVLGSIVLDKRYRCIREMSISKYVVLFIVSQMQIA